MNNVLSFIICFIIVGNVFADRLIGSANTIKLGEQIVLSAQSDFIYTSSFPILVSTYYEFEVKAPNSSSFTRISSPYLLTGNQNFSKSIKWQPSSKGKWIVRSRVKAKIDTNYCRFAYCGPYPNMNPSYSYINTNWSEYEIDVTEAYHPLPFSQYLSQADHAHYGTAGGVIGSLSSTYGPIPNNLYSEGGFYAQGIPNKPNSIQTEPTYDDGWACVGIHPETGAPVRPSKYEALDANIGWINPSDLGGGTPYKTYRIIIDKETNEPAYLTRFPPRQESVNYRSQYYDIGLGVISGGYCQFSFPGGWDNDPQNKTTYRPLLDWGRNTNVLMLGATSKEVITEWNNQPIVADINSSTDVTFTTTNFHFDKIKTNSQNFLNQTTWINKSIDVNGIPRYTIDVSKLTINDVGVYNIEHYRSDNNVVGVQKIKITNDFILKCDNATPQEYSMYQRRLAQYGDVIGYANTVQYLKTETEDDYKISFTMQRETSSTKSSDTIFSVFNRATPDPDKTEGQTYERTNVFGSRVPKDQDFQFKITISGDRQGLSFHLSDHYAGIMLRDESSTVFYSAEAGDENPSDSRFVGAMVHDSLAGTDSGNTWVSALARSKEGEESYHLGSHNINDGDSIAKVALVLTRIGNKITIAYTDVFSEATGKPDYDKAVQIFSQDGDADSAVKFTSPNDTTDYDEIVAFFGRHHNDSRFNVNMITFENPVLNYCNGGSSIQ